MADSNTTTYSFVLPEVGASADSWGTKLNSNFSSLDDLLDGGTAVTGINIDSGTIDGATIATSNVTVGAGKTLDVSAGTLTLAANQISGDKVEGGTIAATTITTLGSTTLNTTTLNATTVDLGNWTVTESVGVLYFATGGVNKMKVDASGNLTVVGNVTAYGSM